MRNAKERKALIPGFAEAQGGGAQTPASRVSRTRKMNRLKDEVYREMLLIEVNRPGAEMGLALALLRAVVHSGTLGDPEEFQQWLKDVCPLGLRMIEISLRKDRVCSAGRSQATNRAV